MVNEIDRAPLSEVMARLGITKYPPSWEADYARQEGEWHCPGVDEEFLYDLNRRHRLFEHRFEQVLRAAGLIRPNPDLMTYMALMTASAAGGARTDEDIKYIETPTPPEGTGDPLGYDLAPLFALLPGVDRAADEYYRRGAPEDAVAATLRNYEKCIDSTEARLGRPGYAPLYFRWSLIYNAARILYVGRLNFVVERFSSPIKVFVDEGGAERALVDGLKIHSSGYALGCPGYTEPEGSIFAEIEDAGEAWRGYPVLPDGRAAPEAVSLKKSEWRVALERGDPVLSVHIPATGSFDPVSCERAYSDALEIFGRCYPEYDLRAMVCYSWLMDPQLELMLKPGSNIVAFQRKYSRFPVVTSGRGVFQFVFLKPFADLHELPENTSLERALKEHYLSGQYIHELGGYFLI